MEIKDITGFSVPATKLIEAMHAAVGTVYRPQAIRREADAEAYAIEVRARAEAKAHAIQAEGDARVQELAQRARNRLVTLELGRQENIDAIVEEALGLLPESVSDEPVDRDWMSRFFQECQDVSDEELRKLWAKLLANEVAEPGGCSRRTLTVLRDVSPNEARRFTELCPIACQRLRSGQALVFRDISDTAEAPLVGSDAQRDDLMKLEEAGLLLLSPDPTTIIHFGEEILVGHIRRTLLTPSSVETVVVAVAPFTSAGAEIFRIADSDCCDDYHLKLERFLKRHGITLLRPGEA